MKSDVTDLPGKELKPPTPQSHEYCRAVIEYFRSHSTDVATVDELGSYVYDRTNPEEDDAKTAIHLHHVTLPRLVDAGLVDYDVRSNTARYRGRTS